MNPSPNPRQALSPSSSPPLLACGDGDDADVLRESDVTPVVDDKVVAVEVGGQPCRVDAQMQMHKAISL